MAEHNLKIEDGISFEGLADSYFIQESETEVPKAYYFDSYDAIKIIQGVWWYVSAFKFDYNKYLKDKSILSVYAFAYQGLYGKIQLLEPHRLELIRSIEKHETSLKIPQNKSEYDDILSEVVYRLGLSDSGQRKKINSQNIEYFIDQFVNEGTDLYKASFLLREYIWPKRFKYLISNNLLDIGSTNEDLDSISDLNLFNLIKQSFDILRPDPLSSINNYFDAMALYFLQQKLNQFVNNRTNVLPVFYASSSTFFKAVKIIHKKEPKLFLYKDGENSFPIVRDSLYFILEAVFRKSTREDAFFNVLRKSQPEIKKLVKSEYDKHFSGSKKIIENLQNSKREFEDSVRNIINTKFIQSIWLEKRAYKDLISDLHSSFIWDENESSFIADKIQDTLKEILIEAKQSLDKSQELISIIKSFSNLKKEIKNYQSDAAKDIDIFKDFALLKFGLENHKNPNLNNYFSDLIHDEFITNYPPILSHIISILNIVPETPEKSEKFLYGISICWILNKQKLIVMLCSRLSKEDIYIRYEIALIYAASIISTKKNQSGISDTLEIVKCILSKEIENYRIDLGIGYLYYRFWEIEMDYYHDLPEMNVELWSVISKKQSYQNYYCNGAIFYTRKVFNYLKPVPGEILKENHLGAFLYSINNLIYYTTKCGSKEDFDNIEPLVEEFKRYRHNEAEWQGRFFDTLGWHSLRKSIYAKDMIIKDFYLNEAMHNYSNAKDKIALPREIELYQVLLEAIIKVRERNGTN